MKSISLSTDCKCFLQIELMLLLSFHWRPTEARFLAFLFLGKKSVKKNCPQIVFINVGIEVQCLPPKEEWNHTCHHYDVSSKCFMWSKVTVKKFVSCSMLIYNWLWFPFLQEIVVNLFCFVFDAPVYLSTFPVTSMYLTVCTFVLVLEFTEISWQNMSSFFEGECKQEILSGSLHVFQLNELFQPIEKKDSKHSSGQSYHLMLALLLPLVRKQHRCCKSSEEIKNFNFVSSC